MSENAKTAVVQPQLRLENDSKPVNVVQPVRAAPPEVKQESEPKMTNGPWLSVGIFSGTTCKVTGCTTQDLAEELRSAHFDITKMPAGAIDETAVLQLEPGEFYRFRVRSFNSCGFGPWSEAVTFRTTMPGFPSSPSGVKITATQDGVHLSWQPPQDQAPEVSEYSVYLAVRGDGPNYAKSNTTSMSFKRVYIGAASSCLVPTDVLSDAERTAGVNAAGQPTKPAILFRIAARNKKGYGPSIQVRWIQGEVSSGTSSGQVRNAGQDSADAGSTKKKRKE